MHRVSVQLSISGGGLQSLGNHDSARDYARYDGSKEQQPAPVLIRISDSANEVPSIMFGKDGDKGVAYRPAESNQDEKLLQRVCRSTCGCEQEASGGRERHGRGDGESPGAPPLEES